MPCWSMLILFMRVDAKTIAKDYSKTSCLKHLVKRRGLLRGASCRLFPLRAATGLRSVLPYHLAPDIRFGRRGSSSLSVRDASVGGRFCSLPRQPCHMRATNWTLYTNNRKISTTATNQGPRALRLTVSNTEQMKIARNLRPREMGIKWSEKLYHHRKPAWKLWQIVQVVRENRSARIFRFLNNIDRR